MLFEPRRERSLNFQEMPLTSAYQKDQPQTAIGGSDELGGGFGAVGGMPVDDQIHRPGRIVE